MLPWPSLPRWVIPMVLLLLFALSSLSCGNCPACPRPPVTPPPPPPIRVEVPVRCQISPPQTFFAAEDWPDPNPDGSTTLPIEATRKLGAQLLAFRQFLESYLASCYEPPE